MPSESAEHQHAWEDSKENFQPVRDGRKPGELLDTKAKEERTVLQPKGIEPDRARFVEAIEGYTGDDPLEKWLDYIKWTKETFVSAGKTSEMLTLLEKCTREFHESERYRDDVRYLRVWIQYADCLPDPSDVFSYMMDNNIGQGHALFFIAYATYCELTRNYALADGTYQKGIQAKAAPLDRLEAKHAEFQHRMVRRIQRKAEQAQEEGQAGTGSGAAGQEGQAGARGNINERRGLKTIRGPLGPRPVDKRRNMASNVGSNSIPVFEDDQFSSSTVQPPPRGRMVLPAGHVESQKENVQAAVPWMGQTIKQKSSSVASKPKEHLDIMEDPEFAASAVCGGDGGEPAQARGAKASLRQRFDRDGIEEQLSSDPLLLLKNPPPKVVVKKEHADGDGDGNGDDLVVDVKLEANPDDDSKMPSPFDHDVTMATSDAYKAMNCLFTGDAGDDGRMDDAGAPVAHVAPGARDLEPTMTINTRDALNAVNNMFKASFNVDGDNKDDHDDDKDETVYVSGNDDARAGASEDVGGGGGGLMIREDTVFLPADGDRPEGSLNDDDVTGAFSIREDTVFIGGRGGRAGVGAGVNADDDTGAFSIREDTVFIGRGAGAVEDDTGAFSIREDTVFISSGTVPPAGPTATNAGGHGLGLIVPMDDEFNDANDENAAPEGLVQVGARRERAVHAPLSPLGLGPTPVDGFEVEVEQDDEAEAALAGAGAGAPSNAEAVVDEGFAVFEDAKPGQRRINPFDCSFQGELVASLNPPVSEWPGVVELTDEDAVACEAAFKVVKKEGAADAKKKKPTTKASANANAATELVIRDVLRATITGQIGEGAYATVYGATCDGVDVALKVEYPPCPWEFLLCKIIEGRSAPDACLTVNPTKMLLHERFSVLVMPRGSGTLQDLLNMYLSAKIPVDQTVTASICLTLFRAMKQLHDNKVVHNDIKPDNILFSISEDAVSVSLIDVGRGVDLELLPEDAVLFGDSETESFRCIEMRERVPWLWQADAYAVASVIHCLILGEYMEVDRVENEATGERYVRSRAKLPRSYDAELWEAVLKDLLNASADCPPNWDGLMARMQGLLQDEPARSKKSALDRLQRLAATNLSL